MNPNNNILLSFLLVSNALLATSCGREPSSIQHKVSMPVSYASRGVLNPTTCKSAENISKTQPSVKDQIGEAIKTAKKAAAAKGKMSTFQIGLEMDAVVAFLEAAIQKESPERRKIIIDAIKYIKDIHKLLKNRAQAYKELEAAIISRKIAGNSYHLKVPDPYVKGRKKPEVKKEIEEAKALHEAFKVEEKQKKRKISEIHKAISTKIRELKKQKKALSKRSGSSYWPSFMRRS